MSRKICHVVMFSMSAENMEKHLSLAEFHRHLQQIRETVPGLIEVNFGPAGTDVYPGYVPANDVYTHCLVSKHVDGDALQKYAVHPNHVSLLEKIKLCVVRPPLRIDFELPE